MNRWGNPLLCLVLAMVSFLVGTGLANRRERSLADSQTQAVVGSSKIWTKQDFESANEEDWQALFSSLRNLTLEDIFAIAGIEDEFGREEMRFADWGHRDPLAAIEAALKRKPRDERFGLIEEALWAAAENAPETALPYLVEFTTPPFEVFYGDVHRLISNFFERWADRDLEAVKAELIDPHWKKMIWLTFSRREWLNTIRWQLFNGWGTMLVKLKTRIRGSVVAARTACFPTGVNPRARLILASWKDLRNDRNGIGTISLKLERNILDCLRRLLSQWGSTKMPEIRGSQVILHGNGPRRIRTPLGSGCSSCRLERDEIGRRLGSCSTLQRPILVVPSAGLCRLTILR
jgi:hypothetical protein